MALSIILGAELGPKANAATSTYDPRPEWYFFFLFELLRVIKPPKLHRAGDDRRADARDDPPVPAGRSTIGVRSDTRLRRPLATATGIFVIGAMAYLTYLGANAGPPDAKHDHGSRRPSSRRARGPVAEFYLGRSVIAQSGCEACHKIGDTATTAPPRADAHRGSAAGGGDRAHAGEPRRSRCPPSRTCRRSNSPRPSTSCRTEVVAERTAGHA